MFVVLYWGSWFFFFLWVPSSFQNVSLYFFPFFYVCLCAHTLHSHISFVLCLFHHLFRCCFPHCRSIIIIPILFAFAYFHHRHLPSHAFFCMYVLICFHHRCMLLHVCFHLLSSSLPSPTYLFSFTFAIIACSHLLVPICFRHCYMLLLVCPCLLLPSLLTFACMFSLSFTIVIFFHLHAFTIITFSGTLPTSTCFITYLLALLFVCLSFKLTPFCLVFLPLFVCARGGT